MFFLDVGPTEAYERLRLGRRNFEMFETPDKLRQTRFKALSLALMDNWIIINANKSAEVIENEIESFLEDRGIA